MKGDKCVLTKTEIDKTVDEPCELTVSFEPEDLFPVPAVSRADGIGVELTSYESDGGVICRMSLSGEIVFGAKAEKRTVEAEEYLSILDDPEETDIAPVRGRYDFLPAIKAVFYSAVPKEDTIPYETRTDDYEVISEEEYEKRLAEPKPDRNPFAALAEHKPGK